MTPIAFALILLSACIHGNRRMILIIFKPFDFMKRSFVPIVFIVASWNTAAKHMKGSTAILVFAHMIGSLLQMPLAIRELDMLSPFEISDAFFILIPSILAHGMYILLLSLAYNHGDVGLVSCI